MRGAFPISRSSAVCRQRWTVRLGEVEPVFGQTGRVVLDITARTAHDGALKWTRPSTEPRDRNIPVHLRTALRRALEFEARAPAPRSAEEVEQCEEQLRAIADEFFGALLTPVLQRGVLRRGWRRGERPRAPPAPADAELRETVNVRTSRGTTVPVTTPYYREKHASGAGTLPRLGGAGMRCTPKLADASRAVAMHSSLAEAQAQLRSEGIALDIKTLRSTAYRYAARARAAQQSAACGLLDRVTGGRLPRRGPRPWARRNRFHTDWTKLSCTSSATTGDRSQTWRHALRGPGTRGRRLNAADKVLFIAEIWRLSRRQVLGLIDFYHAAKQLSDAVKLRRWSATQRTRWLNRTQASTGGGVTALTGRTAGDPHAPQLLPEEPSSFRAGSGFRGAAAPSSAGRRVINLRIKGASIYWLPESVDAIRGLDGHDAGGCERVTGKSGMRPE